MGKKCSMETHDFYCVNCGNKGLPLSRKKGFQHGKFHLKKLYCFHCKQELNHIECKNPVEVEEFRKNFEKGVYKDEAEKSLSYGGGAR
jgi:hypothetical protein